MLNKVLFFGLLVLGLFFQPSHGIAGGFSAKPGQFQYMIVYTYPFNQSGTVVNYQGTGILFNSNQFFTTANALSQCSNGTVATAYLGVTDLGNTTGAAVRTFICVQNVFSRPGPFPTSQVRIKEFNTGFPANFTLGNYLDDVVLVNVSSAFPPNNTLRMSTSSPLQTQSAIKSQYYIVGYGESIPGGPPSPQLVYAPINPMNNRICYNIMKNFSLQNNFSFADSFCLQGQANDNRTGFITDACSLDRGGALIRTSNISSPQNSAEVVGIINFGSCSATLPIIVSYIWRFVTPISPDGINGQNLIDTPNATSPPNPEAQYGVFACGDNIIEPGTYEKCDVGTHQLRNSNGTAIDPNVNCCDPWTCQFYVGGTPCSATNDHSLCDSQPRCNGAGHCQANKKLKKDQTCAGKNTFCKQGRCCHRPHPVKTSNTSCIQLTRRPIL